jgi:hypothetical protein
VEFSSEKSCRRIKCWNKIEASIETSKKLNKITPVK